MAFFRGEVGCCEGEAETDARLGTLGQGSGCCTADGRTGTAEGGAIHEVAVVGTGFWDGFGGCLLTSPGVPQCPAKNCACAAPADNRYWGDTLLVDTNERAYKDRYRGYVLHYDCGVRN